jgi:hypothetical protein
MMKSSMKSLLFGGALAAVALAPMTGALAQVQCSTDGYDWHCRDFGPAPPPVWGYSPGPNNFGGDYNQIPNDYPGPAPVYNNRY